jgi:transglutaminase-like putative cysteine protease
MTRLSIMHETRYDYDRAVSFGLHRLLIRPRDSHSVRVVEASLQLSPPGKVRWLYDALSNCVCLYQPQGQANSLSIISRLVIERFPAPLSGVSMDDPHTRAPPIYEREDRTVVAPFLEPATDDDDPTLLKWLRGLVMRPDEMALEFVLRMNAAIHQLNYQARGEEGCQSPAQTLARGSGTCRDFAWLMVEGLRRLGFAARFVTGYLYSPSLDPGEGGLRGAGATHAWCEVFLPGLGWIEMDPTNNLAESPDLIPVAVTRTPAQAAPVTGSLTGDPGGSSMTVRVEVSAYPNMKAVA